jgi:hypothetical protein
VCPIFGIEAEAEPAIGFLSVFSGQAIDLELVGCHLDEIVVAMNSEPGPGVLHGNRDVMRYSDINGHFHLINLSKGVKT